LQPVGSIANIQICGTTSCMICGAEDLVAVCKELINEKPHALSADGKFSWEEVECLGACTNAPMAQIGKDYYEDLTPDSLRDLIARFSKGEVPVPGPQNGRYASEPLGGLTSLKDYEAGRKQYNASVQAAVDIGETVKRIDGTEVPILTPWLGKSGSKPAKAVKAAAKAEPKPAKGVPADKTGVTVQEAQATSAAKPATTDAHAGTKPEGLAAARDGKADDLKQIKGIGPKLEILCNSLGFYHFDQIANWTEAEVAWVDENLEGFKGRVTRDTWVEQAKILAAGGATEFSKRVDKGGVY
jgi:NADH-quinone oxidoreductase subunit E